MISPSMVFATDGAGRWNAPAFGAACRIVPVNQAFRISAKGSTRDMSRPTPLHGQVEEDIIEYRCFRTKALANRKIGPREGLQLIVLADRLAARALKLVETDAAINAAIGGKDGIRSERFLERVKRANRGVVLPFPEIVDPLEAA